MKQTTPKQEWLRVLGKGMITIPKSWRDEFGIEKGDLIIAEKTKEGIILNAESRETPYRIFTQEEIDQWIKDDYLPEDLRKKIDKKLGIK